MTTLKVIETFNVNPSRNVASCSTERESRGAMKEVVFRNLMLCVGDVMCMMFCMTCMYV